MEENEGELEQLADPVPRFRDQGKTLLLWGGVGRESTLPPMPDLES